MRLHQTVLHILFFGFAACTAAQASTYGLGFFDQAYAASQSGSQYYPGVNVQNLQQTSYSDSSSVSAGPASATISGSITSDGALHGYSQTAVPLPGGAGATAYANLDAYFYDTFYIAGPSGQSGTFAITMNFDGSAPCVAAGCISANGQTGDLFDAVNTFNLVQNGTIIPGAQYGGIIGTLTIAPGQTSTLTKTVDLTLAAGHRSRSESCSKFETS